MPSECHRWLVVWLSRRLEREGYRLVAADSYESPKDILASLPVVPIVAATRPDLLAVNRRSGLIALGDAKTPTDLSNSHTIMQLRAMLRLRDRAGRPARVYLAFPRSALALAAKVVMRLGFPDALRVRLVAVPDVMLREKLA